MAILYQTVAYTTTGTKTGVFLDPSIAPFQAAVQCTVGTTATYKLQYSLDPQTVTDAAAIWADSSGIPAATAATAATTFIGPVSRVRVVIAAVSGTLTLQTQQGISTN